MATVPVVRGTPTTGGTQGATTYTIAKPTGVVQGDLLIAWVTNGGSGSATAAGLSISGGSAWSQINAGHTLATYGAAAWFISTAGASEPVDYTVTFNGPSSAGGIIAFQSSTFDAFNPVDLVNGVAYASSSTASTTVTTPTVPGGVVDGVLLSAYVSVSTVIATPTFTMSTSGQTEQFDVNSGASGYVGTAVSSRTLTAAGTTAAQSATQPNPRRRITGSLVVNPYSVVNYTKTLADTAAGTDSATAGLLLTKTAADVAAGTDAATATRIKGASDVAAGTDAVTTLRTSARVLADAGGTADEVTATFQRTDIVDYQFSLGELLASDYMPFGLGQTIVVESFTPGATETRDQDVLSPVADVRHFGVDRRTPGTWDFEWYTDVESDTQALLWAQNLEAVWNQEATRSTPGAVLPLRYALGGRIRRVYGRPRNFDVLPSTTLRTGRLHMLGDFTLADTNYYEDIEQSVRVGMRYSQDVSGGYVFPVTFPMVDLDPSPIREELIVVGGTRPTWIDIKFTGPCVDPWVQIGNYRWGLRGSLTPGVSVLMSGVPWRQGLLRNDGAWVPGMLDPRARLSQLRLPPGTYTATLGGYAQSSTARADISWRAAYGTM